jgi:hypothetical protein
MTCEQQHIVQFKRWVHVYGRRNVERPRRIHAGGRLSRCLRGGTAPAGIEDEPRQLQPHGRVTAHHSSICTRMILPRSLVALKAIDGVQPVADQGLFEPCKLGSETGTHVASRPCLCKASGADIHATCHGQEKARAVSFQLDGDLQVGMSKYWPPQCTELSPFGLVPLWSGGPRYSHQQMPWYSTDCRMRSDLPPA